MSLDPDPGYTIPAATARATRAVFPKGNLYLRRADAVGTVYTRAGFTDLFSVLGQPAVQPVRLAQVCILQFLEGLTDQQAADAVRTPIDWKISACPRTHRSRL